MLLACPSCKSAVDYPLGHAACTCPVCGAVIVQPPVAAVVQDPAPVVSTNTATSRVRPHRKSSMAVTVAGIFGVLGCCCGGIVVGPMIAVVHPLWASVTVYQEHGLPRFVNGGSLPAHALIFAVLLGVVSYAVAKWIWPDQ